MAFQHDIAAAVEALGVEDVGLIWGLGMVPWVSDDERDAFLAAVKNKLEQ